MKLYEAITYAIEKEGTDIIGRSLLVNYLADLQAYDTPAVKRIVETIVKEGYGEKLVGSLHSSDYELQIADIESRMVRYEGYQHDLVQYVISCVSYALGMSAEQPIPPVSEAQIRLRQEQRDTAVAEKEQLKFLQTSNGYQTDLDGERYVIDEREYKAIMLMKDMPIERLKIWLKAYTERENYNIQINRHSFLNLSTIRPYSCLFKERGIVMTNASKWSAINRNIDLHVSHSSKTDEIISNWKEEKARTANLWITLYKQCTGIINFNDLVKTKAAYEREWKNKDCHQNSYFIKPAPKESDVRNEVIVRANKEFDIESLQKTFECEINKLQQMIFTEKEPTIESVSAELSERAMKEVNSILPWKRTKIRKEFIESHIDDLLKEEHTAWNKHQSEFISKKDAQRLLVENKEEELNVLRKQKVDYINKETKRIHNERMQEWTKERDRFFEFAVRNFQDGINGNSAYIESAIGVAFNEVSAIDFDLDIKMKFFVDFVYQEENSRVLVDLRLPRIEDTPTKKRKDYANCVFGLSMYVANTIFNQSVKIKEVEVAGHTQRVANNSALITDQYVFVVKYERELFDRISVSGYTPVQMVEFFPHCKSMTETYLLREINLATAYPMIITAAPIDFDEYMTLHPIPEETSDFCMQDNVISDSNSASYVGMHNFDPLLEQVAYAIIEVGFCNTSMIQRKFSIGYNRTMRIMDQLEELGIIESGGGARPRDVLVNKEKAQKIISTHLE